MDPFGLRRLDSWIQEGGQKTWTGWGSNSEEEKQAGPAQSEGFDSQLLGRKRMRAQTSKRQGDKFLGMREKIMEGPCISKRLGIDLRKERAQLWAPGSQQG